jgi:3-oxoacyl-[acyl-carrier protein] reductase
MSNETKKLSGKVALVTGASKGIGASIAKHLAAEGAAVVVNYSSSKEGAEKVVAEIVKGGGKAVAIGGNVSKPDEIKRLIAETKKAYGKLDILVNNAGIYEFQPLEAITPEHFHKHFDLNVLGLLLTTQEAVKLFTPEGGSIINLSSIVTRLSFPASTVYTATKAAVEAATRTLAAELGPRKIRVNAIGPGMVETEGTHSAGIMKSPMQADYEAKAPLGRIGQPKDIADAVGFLASDESSWVTGETLFVGGGYR